MAFKHKNGCLTCNLIKQESPKDPKASRMYKLIDMYHLKSQTLTAIHSSYPQITYLAIRNHALKHQNPSEKQLIKSREKEIVNDARYKEVSTYKHHNDNRKELIAKGMEALQSGDMRLTSTVLAQLLKQEADIEEKQKDRSFEVFKMMAKFQSGELELNEPSEPYPTPKITILPD